MPLPLYTTPPRSLEEYHQRIVTLLTAGWCQRVLARLPDGKETSPFDPAAASCCMFGAVRRATSYDNWSVNLENNVERQVHRWQLDMWERIAGLTNLAPVEFNDYTARNSEEVLEVVHRALPRKVS